MKVGWGCLHDQSLGSQEDKARVFETWIESSILSRET